MTRPLVRALLVFATAALVACGGKEDPKEAPAPVRPPIATYPVRHILVALGPKPARPNAPKRTLEEARARARAVIGRLKAGEDFALVSAEMSDDAVHVVDGGFVGFVATHLGDPEDIVKSIAALPDGGISEPLETDAAVYVIQRLSREEGKVAESRVAAAVEGFLVQWHDLVRSLPASQTREQAYAEAAAALAEIQAGRLKADAAMARLPGARPAIVGLRRRTITGYEKAAEAFLDIAPGSWGGPVETKDGWLVARRLPYERFTLSHVLVTHKQGPGPFKHKDRTEQEAVVRAELAIARLRADPASWDAVVREFSDDAVSRDRGGRLGDVSNVDSPGRHLPAEVEQAGRQLAPGAISEAVPGRLGVHVLRRGSE